MPDAPPAALLLLGSTRALLDALAHGLSPAWRTHTELIDTLRYHVADPLGKVVYDAALVEIARPGDLIVVRSLRRAAPSIRLAALASGINVTPHQALDAGADVFLPRSATIEDVIRALNGGCRRTPGEGVMQLTAREGEVVEHIAAGLSNQEIAHALTIEVSTVKKHVHRILEKLGVQRRTQAAAVWTHTKYTFGSIAYATIATEDGAVNIAARRSGMAEKKLDLSRLETLSPDQRERVETALKTTLEHELAGAAGLGEAVLGGRLSQHSKAASPWHSKQYERGAAASVNVEDEIAHAATTLDDAAFQKFTQRLETLRNLKGGGL